MKKGAAILVCVLLLATAFPVSARISGVTYYIDSISGSDEGNGLSPETAWKSVPVSAATLSAGDSVLFRRGGRYACALTLENCIGTPDSPIRISAYGTGKMPVLYTDEATEVLRLFDCAYCVVSDLEITAPHGGGIWIDTLRRTSSGITLANLRMHDIQNTAAQNRDLLGAGAAVARACVMVKGLPARSRFAVNNLTIKDCEMYDCGNGVSDWGSWNDSETPWDVDTKPDPVYNENHRIENCSMHDMDAEALIFGVCQNSVMTNCRCIDCCQGEGVDENGEILYFTAAAWFWGADHCTIEHCEIAGQKNVGDGMTVDFDSQSNYCTYQYIYSHDNVRFVCNNAKNVPQTGNVVRCCLSVNDDGGRNLIASSHGESGMQFYNNTIVNSQDFYLAYLTDSLFVNNIVTFREGYALRPDKCILPKYKNTFSRNCYSGTFPIPLTGAKFAETPGFAGNDITDPLSFRLSAQSPLLGAGADLKASGAETDFFSEPIRSKNIGCYGGVGVQSEFRRDAPLQRLRQAIRSFLLFLPHFLFS